MKRSVVVSVVMLVCLISASAHGQARSSNPPQGAQADAARLANSVASLQAARAALTEAQVQQQLQEILVQLQRAQQLRDQERVSLLREVERAVVRLQTSTNQPREVTLQFNQQATPGQRGTGGDALAGRRLIVRPSSIGGVVNVQVAGGAWWTDAPLVARLGLTEDQRSRIERAFTNHRVNLEATRANLEKEEAQLARLLDSEPLDRNAVSGQIFRVTNARGEMERENAAMTLEMREQMTLAQWNQLQTLQPRAMVMVDVPVTPFGTAPAATGAQATPFGLAPPAGGAGARGGGGRGQRGQQ